MSVNRTVSLIAAQTNAVSATRSERRVSGGARFASILENTSSAASQISSTAASTTAAATTASTATTTSTAATTSSATSTATSTSYPNLADLVTKDTTTTAATTAKAADTVTNPTAESVFGSTPWMSSPGGSSDSLGAYSYNQDYFASKETADKVAQLLGGTVVQTNAMVVSGSPFKQTEANYMVQLPNGHLVNPGLTATYYTHGWSQSQIDTMLGYDRNV
jgi:hypothetical protein